LVVVVVVSVLFSHHFTARRQQHIPLADKPRNQVGSVRKLKRSLPGGSCWSESRGSPCPITIRATTSAVQR